ncbi:MAG: enoyl-CoA hydratase/isomerase family protein [Gammaproteobacteria bacterium]|nr:enoyl-CoA hydratase/isomerase family protein [Gammaproteobacteria bacterium]
MDKISYSHWHIERDEDNIAWLTFDKQDSKTNTIDLVVLEELLSVIQSLETGTKPLGLVIDSSKKNGFCAGADIQQFKNTESLETIVNLIQQGQTVFNHLASVSFPTVALIEGYCLGGGLELALACRYRIAIEDPKTKLGLPEVRLGIQPGWGGSVRLPRLIGGLKAMDLILSGRTVGAKAARKMGVVDVSVPKRQSLVAARYFVKTQPKVRTANVIEHFTNRHFVRPILGKFLLKAISAKVNRAHYPAPYAALQHWIDQGVSHDAAFIAEANSVCQLAQSETARNLIRVFDLQEKLRRLGSESPFRPEHVHVVGAGVMGGDIAAWCALKGLRVTLQDQNTVAIATALGRAKVLFKKQLKEPHLVQAAMDRLMPDIKGCGIKTADLIIEAIIEKAEAKKALFMTLASEAKKEAIFATNTSTIPLKELSEDPAVQQRIIGLHFFNPVAKMPLVEVIDTESTDLNLIQHGMRFVRAIEKIPLQVKSSPGFLVNRILMPYLLESVRLFESGIPAVAIDKAAVEFGMPMGPIELADTVGLDVCLYGAESLAHYFKVAIPTELRKRVEAGNLGKKTGQGFYQFKNGKIIRPKLPEHYRLPEDALDRLILSMMNEAVACLREGIVADADALDAGMILGTGFAPFRGGLMHYIAEQGESLLFQRLNLLAQRYGDRFLPDAGWR